MAPEFGKMDKEMSKNSMAGFLMNVRTFFKRIDKAYYILFFFTIIVHGLLFLNDGVFQDTWIIHNFQSEKNWDLLFKLYSDSGRPIMSIVYRTIGLFPNKIFATRIYQLLSIFFSGVFIYKIGKEFFDLYPLQIMVIALVSISYPIYYQFSVAMDVYILYYTIFIVGAYLSFKATKYEGIKHWLLRLLSLVLLFVSFDHSSLLVFYFGFFLLFFIYSQRYIDLSSCKIYKKINQYVIPVIRRNYIKIMPAIGVLIFVSGFMLDWFGFSEPGWIGGNQQLLFIFGITIILLFILFWLYKQISENPEKKDGNRDLLNKKPFILAEFIFKLFYFVFSHPVYLLLPFIFWIIKNWFWPTLSYYAEYNHIYLPWESNNFNRIYLSVYKDFFNNAIFEQLLFTLKNLIIHPLFLICIILLALWMYQKLRIDNQVLCDGQEQSSWFLLVIGLFLLILSIFPYSAVGLQPEPSGWDARHAILLAMPMGLIIAGVIQLQVHRNISAINNKIVFTRLGWVIFIVLIFGFGQLIIKNYLALQTRWIIDRSIMVNMSRIPQYERYSVFWIDNQFSTYEEKHRFYEWAGIFKETWGNESHIGLEVNYEPADALNRYEKYFGEQYILSTFNPNGCQANLTISPGMEGTIENYISQKKIMSVGYIKYLDEVYDNFYLTARYFYYKFLSPKKLDEFLSKVTSIYVEPKINPIAKDCYMIGPSE